LVEPGFIYFSHRARLRFCLLNVSYTNPAAC
jgi:hypothetical protein